ncbi:MAG TPA: FtsQ-type POTRA domain-containing protein [Vicinamibacterales bacterium]|jgi:cell division protein FtsQ|nr:FtsQ-type POTRA domain-containing protein [Vicinamibacterales bacterium]
MPVAAPADKRFRRAHVSPTKRVTLRDAWPKLARLAAVCVVLAGVLYYVGGEVLTAEALTINRITVTGNSRISRGEVIALIEGLRGENMLTADLEPWRQKLLASPWVAEAAMRRMFPGTLAVAITERRPLGIGRINDALYLVDEHGTVIDEYGPNYAGLDLPIIDGLAAHGAADGLLVDEARAALAGRLLSELSRVPDLARRVSQIDVTDKRDAVVLLKNDTVLVRVGDGNFAQRIRSYLDLAPALRDRIPQIDYVDLRFDERVYVRPMGSTTKAPQGKGSVAGRTQP